MVIEKAMQYCRSILQNVSRSFALTIPLVEKNILIPVLVGYLEARVLDSFEDEGVVRKEERVEHINRMISIIKDPDSLAAKQNMKEIAEAASGIISNPHYLDLARNVDKVIAIHRTMDKHSQSALSLWFERMAEGMQKYLSTRIDTFEQLDEYCYYVGGTVGGLVTDLIIRNTAQATPSQRKILLSECNNFGLFLQKVNIIRDFRQDILRNEKIFWPYQMFEERNILPAQALEKRNKAASMAILSQMISNTKRHISSVRTYISAVPQDYPGFRKASIINFLMGVETIKKMEDNPDVFYSRFPVKIDKSVARSIISQPLELFGRMDAEA